MPRPPIRLVTAARVLAAGADHSPGVVEIESGRIVRVRQGRARRADLDLGDGILAPGLIDLQINGAAGMDFLTGTPAGIKRARRYLLSTGVTAFLPTLITAPRAQTVEALRRWRNQADGAPRVLGVHLEGPYLNPELHGAHDRRYLRRPDAQELSALMAEAPGFVRIVTLAPELAGADTLIGVARTHGAIAAAGHTGATYDEAVRAFDRGVRLVSHLFNAMRPLRHRDPGIVAAGLKDRRVTVSLIADLVHVHPAVLQLVFASKTWKRIALVTDAVAAAGGRSRSSQLASRRLRVTDAPRLPDGTLAGSVLRLDQAIRNVVDLGVPLRQAVLMASTVPAAVLGRRDLGRIASGTRADLVAFDRHLRVRFVLVEGMMVWNSKPGISLEVPT